MSFDSLNDQGIFLEVIGFILLLFTGNRNPGSSLLALNEHKESPFDKLRSKIIPDKYVYGGFILGIAFVIIGLIWQLSTYQN